MPPEPQGPPEPEPGSEDWEYVDQPIEVVSYLLSDQARDSRAQMIEFDWHFIAFVCRNLLVF